MNCSRKVRPGRSESRSRTACDSPDSRERAARWKLLSFSLKLARSFGRRQSLGLCTIDDVIHGLKRHGHSSSALGSTAGSVFRTCTWRQTCLRVRSRRRSARGREIKVWQLAQDRAGGGGPPERDQAAAPGRGIHGFAIRTPWDGSGGRGSPHTEPLFSCPGCGEILPASWGVTRCRKRLCVFCACVASAESRVSDEELEAK